MKSTKYYLMAFTMFIVTSCSTLIEEDPKGFINDKTLFDTEAGAQAALLGCYEGISTYYYFGVAYTQLLSLGSGTFWTNHAASLPVAQQTSQPTDALVNNVWRTSYASINSANVVIENIQTSGIKESVKNKVLGEALFLRAMLYFNNVRIWGGVPLRLIPASSKDLNMARTPADKVYEQIIKDLESAKGLLPEPQNQTVGYPHKWAAYALLAKVYLTMAGNDQASPYWQKALDEAIKVYNSAAYKLVKPYKDLWDVKKGNSTESIFEIQFSMVGGSSNGLTQIHMPSNTIYLPNQATAPTRRIRSHKVTFDDFRNLYPGDPRINATFLYGDLPLRDGKTLKVYPNNTTSEGYPYIFKYCDPAYVASVSNCNFIYLRYADVLLMLAECENELRGPSGAYKYINEIMARARDANGNGVSDPTELSPADWTGMTKEVFRERIMLERRIELLGETHEYFDTRRRGTAYLKSFFEHHNTHSLFNAVNDFLFPTDDASLTRLLLMPIPNSEINTNELIPPSQQNPGY
jgi:starch-binding outer membrane protein, SusD/RagB family